MADQTPDDKPDNRSDAQSGVTSSDPTIATRQPRADDQTLPSIVKQGKAGAVPAHVEHPAGELINNRFRLLEVLGQGGMGAVHKALDLRKQEANDRDPYVAIKLLNPEFAAHPESLVALQREARKSQTLAHPNIVTVYDFDRAGDQVYMTMEFLQGKPLDKFLREDGAKGLPPEKARPLLKDICAALAYAHDHGIAHSDLKPGNVFVAERGAKLLDFGIARAVSAGEHVDGVDHDHTYFDPADLGALTPAYASTEMLEGEKPQISDDLYALGLIAYELFTGKHPFDRKTALQAETEGLRPARISGLKRREWRAIERALAFRRERRLASVHGLEHAFEPRRKVVVLSILAALAIAGAAVFYSAQQVEQSRVDEKAIREDVEVTLKHDIAREDVAELLAANNRDAAWSRDLQAAFNALHAAAPEDTVWASERGAELLALLVSAASQQFNNGKLDVAGALLSDAEQWQQRLASQWPGVANGDSPLQRHEPAAAALQAEIETSRAAIAERERQARLAADQQAKAEAARLAAEQAAEQQRRAAAQRAAASREAARQRQALIDKQQATISAAQTCSAKTDFDSVTAAFRSLDGLDKSSANTLRQRLGAAWLSCTGKLASRSTRSAEMYLQSARKVLPADKALAAYRVDPCADLIAGSGGKGRGYTCVDTFGEYRGPVMVVVPSAKGVPLAVGKYEVTRADYARYCAATGRCKAASYSGNQPVTGLSLQDFRGYVAWLAAQSGFNYRIPADAEWLHAARGTDSREDPNRNCTLEALGIRKGQRLVSARTGRAQSWGLVNIVGNAAEVALAGNAAVALGGRHTDPQERCHIDTRAAWDGRPDMTIGLRVMRDIGG